MLIKNKEIQLRVRFLGVYQYEGDKQLDVKDPRYQTLLFVHQPIFNSQQQSTTQNIKNIDSQSRDAQIMQFKFSGFEYPLIERCVKEIQRKDHQIFKSCQYIHLSLKDNEIQGYMAEGQTDLFYGFLSRVKKVNIFNKFLAKEGFAILTDQYKKLDTENIKEFSINYERMIKVVQNEDKNARVNQIGPIWEKYQSEMTKDRKINKLRYQKDKFFQKLSEIFKR
ncbi:UNKNOWN [Stylonychia lemnae]|uniref:Uncharacterized protein n=1 Tax=Stylonychia lemnae TaxID=5949 RepID=A0A077ZXV9_STYLE|nr:UNKNOWN [Stylonychia lemnae]|eukprot:CDW73366.1 UNKNOWN [Stylonychia lemnae]